MRWLTLCLAVTACVLGGCTFYTQCPPTDQPAQPGTAGSSGAGPAGGGSAGTPGGVLPDPAPTEPWVEATSNLEGVSTECGNLSLLRAKPKENLLIAGVAQHGLWSSDDGGDSWQEMGTGDGSVPITNRTTSFAFDPAEPDTFWESGIYNGPGVYITKDHGSTFEAVGDITHIDSVSVDFSDSRRKTMLATEHEKKQALLLSKDNGSTWKQIGGNVPADANFCSHPLVLDQETFLLGCGITLSGDGIDGVYKSTDTGQSWTNVSLHGGGASPPLIASDDSIYWATQFGGGMVRSTDQGDTWTQLVGGGVMINATPVELPDGRIAVLGRRHVLVTADLGYSFRIATSDVHFDPAGLVYVPEEKAFFVWHNTCDTTVPADAIMRFDFDYETDAL